MSKKRGIHAIYKDNPEQADRLVWQRETLHT